MKVVAIVGMCGSGKTVAADVFKDSGWKCIHFGKLVIDEVMNRGLSLNYENERMVRKQIRQEYGQEGFAKAFLPIIEQLLKNYNVVIDGLYTWSEYRYLGDHLKDNLRILCIMTNRRLRYERLSCREIRPLSPAEAIERDYIEIETLQKGGPIAIADDFIINDGKIDIFRHSIYEYIARLE